MKLELHDAKKAEAAIVTEAGFRDARPDVADAGCLLDAGSSLAKPLPHACIIWNNGNPGDDNDECDGHHDPLPPFPPNLSTGNGFDDNCNGLVDEGCSCDNVGATKTCYLVPASQTVDGAPVGWCAQNSKGTEVCSQHGEGVATWTGVCRGAQAPYATDVCAPGDFNCDGVPENPVGENCACNVAPVQCPTEPLTTVPYPPPNALPLQVNAAAWFANPQDVALATDWSWTLSGGDCDNILPHPTFRMYATNNGVWTPSTSTSIAPVGTENDTLGMTMLEHGWVATGAQITAATPPGRAWATYPAFSLSGDYALQVSWMLAGKDYTCSVKIQVRAPGLRAEGCWSTEGVDDDLDLHMAKINDFPECATTHAWSDSECSSANEDCYYGDCYSADGDMVDWGYPNSPAASCNGWGSQGAGAGTSCGNPRLDRDANGESGQCDPNATNPANLGSQAFGYGGFCGPENINVDNPHDNDRFAVGLRFFGEDGDDPTPALSHVNIYCDGVRILSAGYDPTVLPVNPFPALLTQGGDTSGDMWKVGIVTTHVTGAGLVCDVVTTQSTNPDPERDGSSAYCVDHAGAEVDGGADGGDGAESQALLMSTGQEPANANALCFH